MLDTLAREGIAFIAIKEQICIEGKQDIQTKVMTTLFALFAEVERDLISERTRERLAKARSSGKKFGRPKGLETADYIVFDSGLWMLQVAASA